VVKTPPGDSSTILKKKKKKKPKQRALFTLWPSGALFMAESACVKRCSFINK